MLDAHHQGRIGKRGISFVIAHPIADDAIALSSAGENITSRTHAETINTNSRVIIVMGEFIIGGAQFWMFGEFFILKLVNKRLRMLHPKSHGEGFSFHMNTLKAQMR